MASESSERTRFFGLARQRTAKPPTSPPGRTSPSPRGRTATRIVSPSMPLDAELSAWSRAAELLYSNQHANAEIRKEIEQTLAAFGGAGDDVDDRQADDVAERRLAGKKENEPSSDAERNAITEEISVFMRQLADSLGIDPSHSFDDAGDLSLVDLSRPSANSQSPTWSPAAPATSLSSSSSSSSSWIQHTVTSSASGYVTSSTPTRLPALPMRRSRSYESLLAGNFLRDAPPPPPPPPPPPVQQQAIEQQAEKKKKKKNRQAAVDDSESQTMFSSILHTLLADKPSHSIDALLAQLEKGEDVAEEGAGQAPSSSNRFAEELIERMWADMQLHATSTALASPCSSKQLHTALLREFLAYAPKNSNPPEPTSDAASLSQTPHAAPLDAHASSVPTVLLSPKSTPLRKKKFLPHLILNRNKRTRSGSVAATEKHTAAAAALSSPHDVLLTRLSLRPPSDKAPPSPLPSPPTPSLLSLSPPPSPSSSSSSSSPASPSALSTLLNSPPPSPFASLRPVADPSPPADPLLLPSSGLLVPPPEPAPSPPVSIPVVLGGYRSTSDAEASSGDVDSSTSVWRQRQINCAERDRLVPGLARLRKTVTAGDPQALRRLQRQLNAALKELRSLLSDADASLVELGHEKHYLSQALVEQSATFESWRCFELTAALRAWATQRGFLLDHLTLLELTRSQLYRVLVEDIEEAAQALKANSRHAVGVVLSLDGLSGLHFIEHIERQAHVVRLVERASFRRFVTERCAASAADQRRRCAGMQAVLAASVVVEDDGGFGYFADNEAVQRRFDDLVLDARYLLGQQLQHFVDVLQREQLISPIDVVDFVDSFVESVALHFHVPRTDKLTLLTHRCVLARVFPLCWPADADHYHELDRRFAASRHQLRQLPPASLDPLLELHAARLDFAPAVDALEELSYCLVPVDMIHCVKKAMQLLSDAAQAAFNAPTSADDLLPLLMYTLVQSNLPLPHQSYDFMEQFASFDHKMGMFGYALTTFQAALSHITNFPHTNSPHTTL